MTQTKTDKIRRYLVVYSKRGFPMQRWEKTEEAAKAIAAKFRKVGYGVDVWAYTDAGARITEI